MRNISGTAYLNIYICSIVALILLLSIASYLCNKYIRDMLFSASQFDHHHRQIRHSDQTGATAEQFRATGLDEATIAGYPKLLYSKVKVQYGSSTTTCCSICLADYKEDDLLMVLPDCGHLFHVKCVYPWLRLHPTCPICRNSPPPVSLCISCSQEPPLLTVQQQ